MEEKKKDEINPFYNWVYKKGSQVCEWYSAWVDRHPIIYGMTLSIAFFSMANDSYNNIPNSSFPFMEWFSVFVFLICGLVFLYITFVYKSKSDVK
jgi:hypothetical protein